MIDKLKHYLQKWQLSDARLLAQTATSHVYTVQYKGVTVVLKLLTPIGLHDEYAGAIALECFAGQGAVRLFHSDDEAHLMEYIDGTDLLPMVENGDDEQATVIIAEVLNKIHSAYQGKPPVGLWTLKRRFQSLFSRAKQDEQAGIVSIFRRAAPFVQSLLENPQEERVLHGDIHHWNIRHHAKRGWLAFDPKGLYGERTFDAANTLCNPMTMRKLVTDEARLLRNAENLAEHLHIELWRLLSFTFAYACLGVAWSLEDDDDPYPTLTVAEILEAHIRK
jgi:streptomycin 6-kinase